MRWHGRIRIWPPPVLSLVIAALAVALAERGGLILRARLTANRGWLDVGGGIASSATIVVTEFLAYFRFFRGWTFARRAGLAIDVTVVTGPAGDPLLSLPTHATKTTHYTRLESAHSACLGISVSVIRGLLDVTTRTGKPQAQPFNILPGKSIEWQLWLDSNHGRVHLLLNHESAQARDSWAICPVPPRCRSQRCACCASLRASPWLSTCGPSAALVSVTPVFSTAERLALAGFLAGYSGLTRQAYELDLRQYASWCRTRHLPLFGARRADIECFARDLGSAGARPRHHHPSPVRHRWVLPVRRRGRAAGSLPGRPRPPTKT